MIVSGERYWSEIRISPFHGKLVDVFVFFIGLILNLPIFLIILMALKFFICIGKHRRNELSLPLAKFFTHGMESLIFNQLSKRDLRISGS